MLDEKLSLLHDLQVIDPDIELRPDNIDVGGGCPICTGVLCVRMSERCVVARNFFILQDVTDHVLELDVRADGELADA